MGPSGSPLKSEAEIVAAHGPAKLKYPPGTPLKEFLKVPPRVEEDVGKPTNPVHDPLGVLPTASSSSFAPTFSSRHKELPTNGLIYAQWDKPTTLLPTTRIELHKVMEGDSFVPMLDTGASQNDCGGAVGIGD